MAILFRNQGENNLEGNQVVASKSFELDGTEKDGDYIYLGGLGNDILVTQVYVVSHQPIPTGGVISVGEASIIGNNEDIAFGFWGNIRAQASQGIFHINLPITENYFGLDPLPDAVNAVARLHSSGVAVRLDTVEGIVTGRFDLVVEYTYLETKGTGAYLS